MKENINVLDELNKGACMGRDAINLILDKVDDKKLKKLLELQYNNYKDIIKKISEIYEKYNDKDEPHETNIMDKMMTWYGVEMKTMIDDSDSKIVEVLLQGTNMGIIEGRRLLNNKKVLKDVKNIMTEFIEMQEKMVEELKKYL